MGYKLAGKEAEVIRKLMTQAQATHQQFNNALGFIALREGLENVNFDADQLAFVDAKTAG